MPTTTEEIEFISKKDISKWNKKLWWSEDEWDAREELFDDLLTQAKEKAYKEGFYKK